VEHSLYGTLHLRSPRWRHCNCRPHDTPTFSALAALCVERTTPELAYLEAKFSGFAAYGLSARLIGEVLPLGRRLHATTLSRQAQAVAQRLEDEVGDERWGFIDTCPRDRDALPRPDMPLVVSLDGGYVHSAEQRSRRDGWFERRHAGRAAPVEGPSKCFGCVQTYDTKPKRRLFDLLVAQGMIANAAVTAAGDDVRDLPLYLNADSEHLLDRFHITMRLTVLANMAKSLRPPPPDEEDLPSLPRPRRRGRRAPGAPQVVLLARQHRGRSRHHQLHRDGRQDRGDEHRAGQVLEDAARVRHLPSGQRRFHPQLRRALLRQRGHLQLAGRVRRQPGDRQADGQEVVDALESSRCPLLLQVRTRAINDDFARWYPGLIHTPETTPDDQPVVA